jgi:hypothetical protein
MRYRVAQRRAATQSGLTQVLDRMDVLRAAEVAVKNYLISLLAGSFLVSLIGCVAFSTGALTFLPAFLVSLFVGALTVTFIAAPIYAGLHCAGIASYVSAGFSALLISAALYPVGGIYLTAVFAAYGLPIALLTHFLAKRERSAPANYNPGSLRG